MLYQVIWFVAELRYCPADVGAGLERKGKNAWEDPLNPRSWRDDHVRALSVA